MVVMDSNILLFFFVSKTGVPRDPVSHAEIDRPWERICYLIQELEKEKTKIVIPTPVLSEVLIRAKQASPEYISRIQKSSIFIIQPFDVIAAIELAEMTRRALDIGDKKSGSNETWAKIKYDRQIIAISKVVRAHTIYSDDKNLAYFAKKENIKVVGLADCPLPPQLSLFPNMKQ
ncbi:PIN domain-containing protein [Pararhodospirillum photometricum]|uniref:PIN domain-containing protein n=1 Tax=Pararhodospirillum photometricum TaxID=1084 RepID=UPI0012FEA2B1|nr:PIN domain-containing protein [Pararhodospirillum photometricum]